MKRSSMVFAALSLSGCVVGHAADDAEAQAELDAEIAGCRCRFLLDETTYDIPCGTTYCLGRAPVRCSLEGGVEQLTTECAPSDADLLLPGLCRQDYPGDYPVDCASVPGPDQCESYGGCTYEPAPCHDASYGCEGFRS